MGKSIRIETADIQEEILKARQLIKQSALPAILGEIDPGSYGISRGHLELLEILEEYLALCMETGARLRNIIAGDRAKGFDFEGALSGKDLFFVNLFSLFTACTRASGLADRVSGGVVRILNAFPHDKLSDLCTASLEGIAAGALSDFIRFISHHRSHCDPRKRLDGEQKTINCADAYFKLMQNTAAEAAADSVYGCHLRALKEIEIHIMGIRFDGFVARQDSLSEENSLIPVVVEEIIGNKEFLQAGMKMARDVAGYDFTEGRNPKKINPVLFALGRPGCGKTVSAHAIGNYFLHYCRERDIPAGFVIIRRTDWASSYQNASAQQLIAIFKEKVNDAPGVVGVYWPDVDTAFAARGDPGLHSEEKNILGAAFGIFDGTILPRNGKWFMICDANFLNMDKATISRITQNPYYVKGPESEEDFIILTRDIKLKEHRDLLLMSDEEWAEFGKKCIAYDFSGRSIENISRKIVSEIEDVDYPEEYFRSDYQRKREILREHSVRMTFSRMKEIIENYYRFEKEAEEKAQHERFMERVDEIVSNLSARQFVMEKLSRPEDGGSLPGAEQG